MTGPALVWLTDWEWACCGDAFAVGDRVEWTALPVQRDGWLVELLGDELAERVEWAEVHHDDDGATRPLVGLVRRIRAVIADSASTPEDPVTFVTVPGTAEFRDLDRLDRSVIDGLSDASSVTLLDGRPVPPPGPDELSPIGGPRGTVGTVGTVGAAEEHGVGWFAAVPRGPHPARRARGVHGYLVDVAEPSTPDSGAHRPV